MECICDPGLGGWKPFSYAKSPESTACIPLEAKGKGKGTAVLYILFTFHFTLLLPTAGTSFYALPSRLFREIVFSIYPEFRRSTIYISNFNYALSRALSYFQSGTFGFSYDRALLGFARFSATNKNQLAEGSVDEYTREQCCQLVDSYARLFYLFPPWKYRCGPISKEPASLVLRVIDA